MVFGAFLAWETRKVQVEALNDSKFIGFSIYNVVTLSILGAIIGVTVDNDVNLSYGSLSALQLIGTAATLNIVFVPKVRNT
jgi:gamma-aminobutyric acid type B receptor